MNFIRLTGDKSFLLINKNDESYYIDILTSELQLIQEKICEDKYTVDKIGSYFIILTNKLGHNEYVPMYCKIGSDCSQKNWKFINKIKLETKIGKNMNDIVFYESVITKKDYLILQILHNNIKKIVFTKFIDLQLGYPFDTNWNVITPYEGKIIISCESIKYDDPYIYINFLDSRIYQCDLCTKKMIEIGWKK